MALERKLKVPSKVIKDTIDYLKEHSSVQKLRLRQKRISRDPSDDHVLALAEQSGADYIITGDEDLLILKRYNKTPIVQPRQFWEILKNKEKRSR
jgi:putative PIN family toxin of toxin-antitoxin system